MPKGRGEWVKRKGESFVGRVFKSRFSGAHWEHFCTLQVSHMCTSCGELCLYGSHIAMKEKNGRKGEKGKERGSWKERKEIRSRRLLTLD